MEACAQGQPKASRWFQQDREREKREPAVHARQLVQDKPGSSFKRAGSLRGCTPGTLLDHSRLLVNVFSSLLLRCADLPRHLQAWV